MRKPRSNAALSVFTKSDAQGILKNQLRRRYRTFPRQFSPKFVATAIKTASIFDQTLR